MNEDYRSYHINTIVYQITDALRLCGDAIEDKENVFNCITNHLSDDDFEDVVKSIKIYDAHIYNMLENCIVKERLKRN